MYILLIVINQLKISLAQKNDIPGLITNMHDFRKGFSQAALCLGVSMKHV